jgi:putative ABC transport system substrate-binding protein
MTTPRRFPPPSRCRQSPHHKEQESSDRSRLCELTPIGVHDGEEIERGITEFAHRPNGGLIVVGPTSSMQRYRGLVVDLAARYRLPAVYSGSAYRSTNALMSYGVDAIEPYRRAASYVDRISPL